MTCQLEGWDVDTLFLDMNGTFMFGHDRFGDDEDYFGTYRALGGRNLGGPDLNHKIACTVSYMMSLDRAGTKDLPAIRDVVAQFVADEADREIVERVIATHERGRISSEDVHALHELGRRYKLVVVSNLWSSSGPWRQYLEELHLARVFSRLVFSSDIGVVKPARAFFEFAIAASGTGPSRIAMVGDDYQRDIVPANGLGMKTIWVCDDASGPGVADEKIPRLSALCE